MPESVGSICFAVQKNCINPYSYGEICVSCGCCSQDKSIRYPARLKLYEDLLKKDFNFNNWIPGFIRLQKRNRKANITYCKRRIAIYSRLDRAIMGDKE